MRVLYWSELFWPYIGGGEVFSAELLPALQECGYEFVVVTSHDCLDLPNEGNYKGIPIYRLPFRKALTAGDMDLFVEAQQQVTRLKRAFRPDLIHISSVSGSVLFHLGTVDAHPAPVVVGMTRELFPDREASLDTLRGQMLRAADWVTCVSTAVMDQVRQWAPETCTHSSVIYTGLGIPLDSPEPLPIDAPQLLCLGRLVPVKGFDLALTALAYIIDRFPHVRLVVAGGGPTRPELERQVAEQDLRRAVDFVGWVEPDKVPALLNASIMVLVPSRSEGLPLVSVQAALLARPIVATRVGGLPEVVVHQRTGLIVEKEDSPALAEAIAFLLDHPETAMKMGQAGRRRAQEVFSWGRCLNAYDALYRKLIREG